MFRRLPRGVTVLAAVVALLGLTGFAGAQQTTYGPPFELGPAGGDQWNYVAADEGGRVTVARAYPVPGGINCPGGGGYANLRIVHRASAPVTSVTVEFAEAAIDPYTFLVLLVRDADGGWLGSRQFRGPIIGDGTADVPIHWPAGKHVAAREITVDFGLQVGSACPSFDGGSVRFTEVAVSQTQHGRGRR